MVAFLAARRQRTRLSRARPRREQSAVLRFFSAIAVWITRLPGGRSWISFLWKAGLNGKKGCEWQVRAGLQWCGPYANFLRYDMAIKETAKAVTPPTILRGARTLRQRLRKLPLAVAKQTM